MPEAAVIHLDAHQRLSTWTDELEFLGYILAEIIDPGGLEAAGFSCHQAADLPIIMNILRRASEREDSRLREISTDHELQKLLTPMKKSKKIRNTMAHHLLPGEAQMRALENVKEEVCGTFESLIQSASSKFNVSQVSWYPYSHKSHLPIKEVCRKETLYLGNGSLLPVRQQLLSNNFRPQTGAPSQKYKATDQSRQEHWQAFEAAQTRRQERQEPHLERVLKQKMEKEKKKTREFQYPISGNGSIPSSFGQDASRERLIQGSEYTCFT